MLRGGEACIKRGGLVDARREACMCLATKSTHLQNITGMYDTTALSCRSSAVVTELCLPREEAWVGCCWPLRRGRWRRCATGGESGVAVLMATST